MDYLLRPVSLFLIVCAGYLLKRLRVFGEDDYQIIAKIVLNVTLPAVILRAFDRFSGQVELFWIVAMGFVCAVLPLAAFYFLTKGQPRDRRVFAMINASGYNIGNFALPLAQEFVSATGLVSICMFDVGNALVVTGGSYVLTAALLHTEEGAVRSRVETVKLFLRRLFSSPPIDAYLIMFLLAVAGLRLPEWVGTIVDPIAESNSFLAMFMIGLMLKLEVKRQFCFDALRMVLLRLLYGAAWSALLFFCTPFALEVRQALAILPLAPIGSLAPVYTERCHGSGGLSSFANSLSILLSFFTMIGVLLLTGAVGG